MMEMKEVDKGEERARKFFADLFKGLSEQFRFSSGILPDEKVRYWRDRFVDQLRYGAHN